ncbi:uncharacterized protein ARMOST_12528 [Armillaria ostoyae]|uniref:Nephrocystin 3-like N-terminal domain-containing protein n=1 Tax=Armillaria ostoyae TaxID=47428 RepID=A0A284RK63_ARMOS|nr:uncharacterized protein ARMOST_12528 [Armillaria ostoyae]
MFDHRIGNAIAQALTAAPAAAKLPASESRTQFRILVQNPLEEIQELQNGGPLVVIIDSLDECDVSTELLEVLADGFGPELPFMHLIISSRPEERIARVFKDHLHLHHYPLDTSSDEGTYNKDDVITWLAERASGLFIWAATVCSFLYDFPSSQRLKVLLDITTPADAMEALTNLYYTALETVVSEVYGRKEDVRQCIRAVLGALIVRKGNMTVHMLPQLVLQEGDPSAKLIVARLGNIDVKKTIQDHYRHVMPSHIGDYAVNLLRWHFDAFIELGINTYRPLFDCYFLSWLKILLAFDSSFRVWEWLKVISAVNAEVTDESLRTYVYHAFSFWERFTGLSKDPVHPPHVYTHAMTISPSANFICRDWGQSSGVNAPFDKERLLALIPCSRSTNKNVTRYSIGCIHMFEGSRHIQSEFILRPLSWASGHRNMFYSTGSVWFDVDTRRILDPSPPSILCFPNLQLPPSCSGHVSTSQKSFYASDQIISLIHWATCCGDGPEYSLNGAQYETIERHNSNPQDAMIFNVDNDNDCDHRTDSSNTHSMFISIANTQTPSRCDNYLLPAIGSDCPVEQYAHGLIVVDKHSGLILKVEPGTTGCRKWMTLDGGANGVHAFAVMEDGSRLLGLMGATGKISLREWETSMGTLCCERMYDCPGPLVFLRCQMSPDGSKVAVSENFGFSQTYILGITSGSSADITDLKDTNDLAWFPDSKRIAYLQSWQCDHIHKYGEKCCDLVVQCLASGQITTINRWCLHYTSRSKILVTPNGSRVITCDQTSDQCEFRTWDVLDL